ncbi:Ubiquitin-conjugating enzyme E2 T [Coemansia sp. RSA 988]|nr:Ubiquitin-conjugating enzyme E2 T [Coemansia sp. RSA 988]
MKGQTTRLLKEFRMLQSDLPPGILCTPKHESLDQYEARIDGPPDTPYEQGRFLIDVALSAQYPMEPPSMRFKTRIYHPNIDNHGNICLDVLKTGKSGCWNPSWTLGRVLVSLTVLLGSPNPHDPLMPDIADQMLNDHTAYVNAAREWTAKHAMGFADDPSEYKPDSSQEATTEKPANESPTAKRRRDAEEKNDQKQQPAMARSGSAAKRSTAISRKASASASPSPEGKTVLPPAHAKLPGPTGIRRLGLSRSSKRSPSANIPPPQPLLASSSPELRHSQPAAPEPRQPESSQAESIEIGSSNDSEDRSEASPGAWSKTDARVARRTKDARLSQILSPLRKKSRRPRRLAASASQTSASSQSAVDEPKITSAEVLVKGPPPNQAAPLSPANGGLPEIASTHDDNVDYDCLLSTDDTTNNDTTASSASHDDDYTLAAVSKPPSPSPSAKQHPIAITAETGTLKSSQEKLGHSLLAKDVVESTYIADKPVISPAAGEKVETWERQESEERNKGKAVDYSMKPLDTRGGGGGRSGEEEVLHESHFGPLDLGLPPVRVSAQRKLMRRRRAR